MGCTSERIAPAGADCTRMILHTTKPPWLPGDLLQNYWASKLGWSSSKNDSREIWSILAPDLWETIAILIHVASGLHPARGFRWSCSVDTLVWSLEVGARFGLGCNGATAWWEKELGSLWIFGAPLVWPITIRRRQMVSGLVRDDWGWDRLMHQCWRAEKSNREGRLLGFFLEKMRKKTEVS